MTPENPRRRTSAVGPESGTKPVRRANDVRALRALVREAASSPVPDVDWARISIGLPEEMEVCHAALKKILG